MKNISYESFCKLIENYQTFTNDDLIKLYEEYGEEKINDYFFKYSCKLDEEKFILFANKYSAYYDKVLNTIENNSNNVELSEVEDTIGYLIRVAGKLPLLNYNEEKLYGSYINEGKEKLDIVNKSTLNETLYPDINIEEILLSTIYSKNYSIIIEKLTELKSLPFKLNDENILKDKKEYLKQYLKNFKFTNPTYEELTTVFKELNFENKRIINEEELLYQLDLLKRYITAKNNLNVRNLKLVISIAKRYKSISPVMQFEDLIQEGNIGLVKAINKYDVNKGFKFSTYATWWIKQNILRAKGDNDNTIRLPIHLVEKISKYDKLCKEYELKNNDTISEEFIAQQLEITIEQVKEIENSKNNLKSLVYLNGFIGEDEDEELIDLIKDDNLLPEQQYLDKELIETIEKVLQENLTEKEKYVIKNRFGMGYLEGKVRTLEDLGQEMNVTRERIRQIESKALRKLKIRSKYNSLKDYRYR